MKRDASKGGLMRRLGSRFIKDPSGATAIEFGFVAVPFFGLLFSIFENSFVLMVDVGLEDAVRPAARQVLLGNVQSNAAISSPATFRDQLICNPASGRILPSYIDCSKVIVNMEVLPPGKTFTDLKMGTSFDGSFTPKFCPGGPGDIVMVNVIYPMPSYFPVLTSDPGTGIKVSTAGLTAFNGSLTHVIVQTKVFQNEPFTGLRPAC